MIRSILWGLFCACSWTWVIGMYLPRLMFSWYGWAGFLLFAIPNVIGCAGFGWVLRTGRNAERLRNDHAPATVWFSIATIGYHLLFAGFLVRELLPLDREIARDETFAGWAILPLGAMAVIFGAGLLLAQLRDRAWTIAAPLLWIGSVTILFVLAPDARLDEIVPSRASSDLLPLAFPIIFGFALCPYLDRTFHRAAMNAGGPATFTIFGLTFAVMLAVTCVVWFRDVPVLGTIALAHLIAQAVFTVGAHLREIGDADWSNAAPGRRGALLAAPWIAGIGFVLLSRVASPTLVGEDAYLRYLALYGLVFPLYVLLFVGPWKPLSWHRHWRTFVLLLIIAAPFYELAFIQGHAWGGFIVLIGLGAWIVDRRRR